MRTEAAKPAARGRAANHGLQPAYLDECIGFEPRAAFEVLMRAATSLDRQLRVRSASSCGVVGIA